MSESEHNAVDPRNLLEDHRQRQAKMESEQKEAKRQQVNQKAGEIIHRVIDMAEHQDLEGLNTLAGNSQANDVARLTSERDSLKAERDRLKRDVDTQIREVGTLQDKLSNAEQERDRYKEEAERLRSAASTPDPAPTPSSPAPAPAAPTSSPSIPTPAAPATGRPSIKDRVRKLLPDPKA